MKLIGFVAAFISIFGVVLGGYCASLNSFLTVGQMRARGINHGLPFIAHLGMWGDLFIITPLVAIIVSRYSEKWSMGNVILASVIAIIASGAMHIFYSHLTFPE